MTEPSAAAQQRALMPRGLIVVLGGTGILVGVLALRQFAEILGPVLLALVLVVGVHPLTGFLRRRGAPMWLAATTTLITLVLVIFGLAASLALSVAQLATLIPTLIPAYSRQLRLKVLPLSTCLSDGSRYRLREVVLDHAPRRRRAGGLPGTGVDQPPCPC